MAIKRHALKVLSKRALIDFRARPVSVTIEGETQGLVEGFIDLSRVAGRALHVAVLFSNPDGKGFIVEILHRSGKDIISNESGVVVGSYRDTVELSILSHTLDAFDDLRNHWLLEVVEEIMETL